MECDEDEDNRMHITPFRFQDNIVPLPFFGTQEDYGDSWMPKEEGDDEILLSWGEVLVWYSSKFLCYMNWMSSYYACF